MKNNPFKSIGAWVGLAVYAGLNFLANYACGNPTTLECVNKWSWLHLPGSLFMSSANTFPLPNFGSMILMLIINATAYFLVGWFVQTKILKK